MPHVRVWPNFCPRNTDGIGEARGLCHTLLPAMINQPAWGLELTPKAVYGNEVKRGNSMTCLHNLNLRESVRSCVP